MDDTQHQPPDQEQPAMTQDAGPAGVPAPAASHPEHPNTPALPAIDVWEGVRFGCDDQGAPVHLDLALGSLLVGGAPRTGSTSAARIPALAAALDPHVRLCIFDGQGGPDWWAFAEVAHRFGLGARPATAAALAACLDELADELDWRSQTLRDLPDADCPDGRLTPALARSQGLDLGLVLLVVDEAQHYLADPEHGRTIGNRLAELVATGPAAGISVVVAAQPAWAWLPMRLLDAIRTRFALPTQTWQDSEAILGGGARAAGLDASTLPTTSPGLGILRQEGGPGRLVRTDPFPLAVVPAICERGRELRTEAGTLTGAAAGEEPGVAER